MGTQDVNSVISLLQAGHYFDASLLLEKILQTDSKAMFREWQDNRSEQEKILVEKVLTFEEEYFTDMTLEEYKEELGGYIDEDGDEDVIEIVPEGYLSVARWIIKVVPSIDPCEGGTVLAQCDIFEKTMSVSEKYKNDDITILHEMIHAYEQMLKEYNDSLREFLILKLYNKLLPLIPNLDEVITKDSHVLVKEGFLDSQKEHTILFLLKSLELDLRLDKPLGTVYAYKRDKIFSATKDDKPILI